MQFLFEEFFGKSFKVINNLHFSIRIMVKLILLFVFIFFIYLGYKFLYQGTYLPIIIVLSLFVLAEIAHFIRKSRERVMVERITIENKLKENQNPKTPKNDSLIMPVREKLKKK